MLLPNNKDITSEMEDQHQSSSHTSNVNEETTGSGSFSEAEEEILPTKHSTFKTWKKTSRDLTKHPVEKPFKCEWCSKAYASKATLKLHARTHIERNPHFCHLCNREFALAKTLQEHLVTHTGIKPHPCNKCNKVFAFENHLTQHKLTHTLRLMKGSLLDIFAKK